MPAGAIKGAKIDEHGSFSWGTSPTNTTPMSKATPMSRNVASPNKGAAPWTSTQARPQAHGSSSPVKSSQARQRQPTQKAKKGFFDVGLDDSRELPSARDGTDPYYLQSAPGRVNYPFDADYDPERRSDLPSFLQPAPAPAGGPKTFSDTPSAHNNEGDAEDGEVDSQPAPAAGRRPLGFPDTDSIYGPGEDLDAEDQVDDQVNPAPTSAQPLAKKGIFGFSSAAPSVTESIDEAPPPKLSTKMRRDSAFAPKSEPKGTKPTDRRKTVRKSTVETRISALDLESNEDGADEVEDLGGDPFSSINIPLSRGGSPGTAKREDRKAPKKQPTAKHSPQPNEDKKPLTKPPMKAPIKQSKPSTLQKQPAKPRQKARPSAAQAQEAVVTSGSGEEQADPPDNDDAVAAHSKSRVPARASKKQTENQTTATNKGKVCTVADSEFEGTETGEEDDDDDYRESRAKSKPKIGQSSKQPPKPRNFATRSKVQKVTEKTAKSVVGSKAKKTVAGDDDDEWAVPVSPPERFNKTKGDLASKLHPKKKVTAAINQRPPAKASTVKASGTRQADTIPQNLSSTTGSEDTSPASMPVPQPAKTANQAKYPTPPLNKNNKLRASQPASHGKGGTDGSEDRSSASKPALQYGKKIRQDKSHITSASPPLVKTASPQESRPASHDTYDTGGSETQSSASKLALQHGKTARQAKQLTSPNDDYNDQASTELPVPSPTEHQTERGPQNSRTAENKNLAKGTRTELQFSLEAGRSGSEQQAAKAVKNKERKALIIPFSADGPKLNGKSKKKNISTQNLQHQDAGISPESNSSLIAEIQHVTSQRGGQIGDQELEENQESQIQSDASSSMLRPSPRDKHQMPSEEKRPRGNRPSDDLANAAARQPSTNPGPDEDEDEDGDHGTSSKCHENDKVQANTAFGVSCEEMDGHDEDGFQFGDESANAIDATSVLDVAKNPNDDEESASAVPLQLMALAEDSDLSIPDQVQGLRRSGVTRKRPFQGEGADFDGSPVFAQHAVPTAPKKQPLSRQLHQQVPMDDQSNRHTAQTSADLSLMKQRLVDTQSPVERQQKNVTQQHASHQEPAMSYKKQPVMMQWPVENQSEDPLMVVRPELNKNQQPMDLKKSEQLLAVRHPTRYQQRPANQQHTVNPESLKLKQPAWKQQSSTSQMPMRNEHAMMRAGQREMNQRGPDLQPSQNREAVVDKLPMFKSFSQPGIGMQSAKAYLQSLSSDFQRPSKRTRINKPRSTAKPLLTSSDDQHWLPPNGYSSDDVFEAEQVNGEIPVDTSVMDRLRGTNPLEQAAEPGAGGSDHTTSHIRESPHLLGHCASYEELAEVASRAGPPKGLSLGTCQKENPEHTSGSDLWRQSLLNSRAQQHVVNTNSRNQEKDNEVDLYAGVGEVMQSIGAGVLQTLRHKEAAVHDVVKDYYTGGARIVRSIVATHAEERKQLVEEHEQNRLNYIRILAEARRTMRSIGSEVEAFNINEIPVR